MRDFFRCGFMLIVLAVCGSVVFLSCIPPDVPVTTFEANVAYPDSVYKVELNSAGYGVLRLEGLESGSEVYLSRVNASRVEYNTNIVPEEAPVDPDQLAEGSRTPSGIITMPDGETRVIYERHWKVTPPDNDTPLASRSAVSRNVTANTVEGDTKSFYVDVTGKTISAKLKETGTYCKIWVDVEFDNLDVSTLVTKFDAIYPVETNLVGFEYGGGPGGNGGVDGDPKVQILVYDIAGGGTLGYFYPGDEYQRGTTYPYSNEAEIFYLDSYLLAPNGMTTIYSTMIHEFNHMINFNVKVLQGGQIRVWNNETWYTEMLSMLAEDVIWPYLNNTPSPVIGMRIPGWRDRYYDYSVMYWPPKTAYTIPYYWSNYAFGAYLVRNFGGVPLFSAIAKSPAGGRASIDGSLRAFNSQNRAIDVTYALERFGETLVYFDNVPDNVYSFNKNTPPETITTHDGTSYNYSFTMFDIRHTSNPPSEPKVFPFNEMGQTPMPINTVQIFQDQSWKNITDGQLDIQFLGVDTGAKYFALIKKN